MTEQALFFAIGFLAAALAALAAAPLVSRRAMRLAAARARLRAPISEKQAIADMDAVRAQSAVEQARVARRLAFAEETSRGLRAAVGRQAAEIIRLRSAKSELDDALDDGRGENERLASRARDLEATVGAVQLALGDALAERDRAVAAQDTAEARAAELDAESSRERARIAVATARAEYLEGRMEELVEATNKARTRVEKAVAELRAERGRAATSEARLAASGEENRALSDRLARATAEHRDFAARIAELEERLRHSDRARADALVENSRQLAVLADREAAASAASARAAALEAGMTATAAEAKARENALSRRAETLAAAHAAVEGSLRAARSEREALQRENDALKSKSVAASVGMARSADAELREAVARFGREVSRLFCACETSDGHDPSAGEGKAVDASATPATPNSETHEFVEGPWRRATRSRSRER